MTAYITIYLPWLLSCINIYHSFLAGSLNRNAWLIALANQCLWFTWIVASGSWGFMPLNLCLWAIYLRNHFKWRTMNDERKSLTSKEIRQVVCQQYRDDVPLAEIVKLNGVSRRYVQRVVREAGLQLRYK